MKLVVLDGFTLNPGDLNWDELSKLGDLVVYERTPPDKIKERAADAEFIFTNKTLLRKDVLGDLPNLKYVGVLATGYNIVDTEAAGQRGITVTNAPAYSTHSVAQLTIALLLELCHHVQRHSDVVINGDWSRSPDFSFWNYPLIELREKTIGIIGFGTIGQKVGDIATALGMNILASSRSHSDQSHRQNFKWVEIPELLGRSDVVSIHCPLSPETKGLINRDSLRIMKRSAFLLNTSRGQIIIDQDLADALNQEIIAGAGLDVLSVEPPSPDNPLFGARNCIITPHIAWATKEARERLMNIVVNNVKAFINGNPVNVVNQELVSKRYNALH
jgi:glycerate dehydrogenase